jgi:guanosine-3',5'-bis(diphosphate) 3'-pyrophosphohydrolase
MQNLISILRAADTAAQWHATQKRKGAAGEPYINHLLEVAALVGEATEGKDPELVIAALLHDAIEDQQISREIIAEKFGEDVASLVVECTDDKTLPKPERKRLQIVNAPHKSARAKLLKLADKVSNLRSVADSPPSHWPAQRRLDYVAWARNVVAAMGGHLNEGLQNKFAAACIQAERAVGTTCSPRDVGDMGASK